jgi:hypothetical protein
MAVLPETLTRRGAPGQAAGLKGGEITVSRTGCSYQSSVGLIHDWTVATLPGVTLIDVLQVVGAPDFSDVMMVVREIPCN